MVSEVTTAWHLPRNRQHACQPEMWNREELCTHADSKGWLESSVIKGQRNIFSTIDAVFSSAVGLAPVRLVRGTRISETTSHYATTEK